MDRPRAGTPQSFLGKLYPDDKEAANRGGL